jgi:pre-mRNA-splicing factor CWC22
MALTIFFHLKFKRKAFFYCKDPLAAKKIKRGAPSEFSLLSAPRVQLACSMPLECAPGIWQAAQTGSAARAESASVGMARSRSGSPSASSSDGDRRRKPSKRRESPAGSDGEEGRDRGDAEARGGGDRDSSPSGREEGKRAERGRSRDTRSRRGDIRDRGGGDDRGDGDGRDGRRDLRGGIGGADRPPAERKPLSAGKAGGAYVPPFKLAQMMAEQTDKTGPEYQRMTWDALKKSINGLVNKVNASNIKHILPELFAENMIRGRGLFARSVMKSQMASPHFSSVFAALVAVVNTKFPELGELVLKRIILQFRRAFKRNDKPVCVAATKFLAHLINQQVVHELIALELLTVLLSTPTNDSVEVAIEFVKECGYTLHELTPQGLARDLRALPRDLARGGNRQARAVHDREPLRDQKGGIRRKERCACGSRSGGGGRPDRA